MKNYFKTLVVFGFALMMTSCLVEDETRSDLNDQGPLLAGFADARQTIGGIASGDEYEFELEMAVKGPAIEEYQEDVTLTVAADPSSTAIEGTHYRFDSKSITLTRGQNYLDVLPITLLSEGIMAPLDESPVLILNVSDAEGTNVVNNGKPLTITFNYLCFSDLAGTYDAVMLYTAYDGSQSTVEFTDTWTETGVGEYRTSEVGHWVSGQLAGVGTPGMTISDVCNEIIIDGQYLVDYYGNWVDDLGTHGTYNPDAGTITVDYSICFPAGADNCRYYSVVYTKQ